MKNRKKDLEKIRKDNLKNTCIISAIVALYAGMRIGNVVESTGQGIMEVLVNHSDLIVAHPFQLWPTNIGIICFTMLIGLIPIAYAVNEYLIKKGTTDNTQGDAAFEEDYEQFHKEFVLNPKTVLPVLGKKVDNRNTVLLDAHDDEAEHKKVLRKRIKVKRSDLRKEKKFLKKKKLKFNDISFSKEYRAIHAAKMNSQIYADKIALNLDGGWTQRNTNALIFGASGAGKSRFFLKPNILQANSCFIVTDPSGDIMKDLGGFLEQEGYVVKCFNTKDMTKSCRFNPLYYIRKAEDIPIIVNTIIDNTKGEAKNGGGDKFWDKATQSLLCAIIGYLFEVCPIEQRNFANVLEILRMAKIEEGGRHDIPVKNDFDKLFEALGEADPTSYAYLNYTVFKQAPSKTALNVLISTGVLISQYVGIPEFKNLTYKDELELDRLGEEKYALFLNIPQADTTYAWITAMLYSITFRLMYEKGEKRMEEEGLNNPELKIPVRFLIDECANVGKIVNLESYLATCRKYRISIVPIFQNFAQITAIYGQEKAADILSNCDTILFLGGRDSETLKIVCDSLGKETVKSLSEGHSKGKGMSNSFNKQEVGRDLMSRIQVEQMSNAMCLVLIRALKPFKVHKYKLEEHPNYRYTLECNPSMIFNKSFEIAYDDEKIEEIRIKTKGEAGYTAPQEVDSARKRARVDVAKPPKSALSKSKEREAKEKEECVPRLQRDIDKVDDIICGYSPTTEFEFVDEDFVMEVDMSDFVD